MFHANPHPAFQICRHVQDIDPYTHEPVVEVEVLQQLPYPVPDQLLAEVRAKYGQSVWVQSTTMWS